MSNKILLTIASVLFLLNPLYAQGLLKLETDKDSWLVKINDQLILVEADSTISVPKKIIVIEAQPQLNYNWPAVFLSDTLYFLENDTVVYTLDKSLSKRYKQTSFRDNSSLQTEQQPYLKSLKSKKQRSKWIKNGLIISAITTNWLSFYLKNRADDSYEKYKSASSLGKIDRYYKKAALYDDYSNVLLGISIATLSAYIYMTLTEE